MRDILFRGKRKDNSEWVEGSAINTQYDVRGEKHIYMGVLTKSEMFPLMQTITWHEVIPESIGQFTGLTKDGKRIFEGDIVKIYLYEPKGLANYEIGCIKFDDTKARFVFCTKESSYSIDNTNTYEIIGNIHDNPELMEAE